MKNEKENLFEQAQAPTIATVSWEHIKNGSEIEWNISLANKQKCIVNNADISELIDGDVDCARYLRIPYTLNYALMRDLNSNTYKLLLHLMSQANGFTLVCYTSKIAKLLGISEVGLRRAYKELIDKGYLVLSDSEMMEKQKKNVVRSYRMSAERSNIEVTEVRIRNLDNCLFYKLVMPEHILAEVKNN